MKSKKIIVIIFILLIQLFGSFTFADEGWEGYTLFNINDSTIDIVKESSEIILKSNKIYYKGEFVIKNKSDKQIESILGLPSNYIQNMSGLFKGSSIKTYNITQRNIIKMNKTFSFPQKDIWRAFNISLKPSETILLTVNYESKATIDENGNTVLKYPFINDSPNDQLIKESAVKIIVSDFKIFNMMNIDGIDSGLSGENGVFLWDSQKENKEIILKYKDVERAALNYLSSLNESKYSKIINSFKTKDYDKTISLGEEVLNGETKLEVINIIKYLISESYRMLNNNSQFIAESNKIDFNEVYPSELAWKVYFDRLNYFNYINNKEEIKKEIANIKANPNKNELLVNWTNSIYNSNSTLSKGDTLNNAKENVDKDFLDSTYEVFKKNIISYLIIFVLALLIGFFLGRASKNNRRNRYMFRR